LGAEQFLLKSDTNNNKGLGILNIVFIITCVVSVSLIPSVLSKHLLSVLTKAIIFSIFAMSLDILVGYTGLFSLGHAAYFGVSSYTVALLVTHFEIQSFWINAPMALLITVLLSAFFGIFALRVSDAYFLIITFAFGELVHSFFVTGLSIAGGWYGLAGVPRPQLGISWFKWDPTRYFYFTVFIFILCFYALKKFTESPFGVALRGIRENSSRMESLGYNTFLYKYVAFIVSGGFAGIAGIIFVHLNGIISPTHVGIGYSTLALLMVLVGGAGTLYGSLLGAILVVFIEYYTSLYLPQRWPLILGGFFILTVMFGKGGVGVYSIQLWKTVRLWKR
jgi:branched-chain amino acid transport system permease protein